MKKTVLILAASLLVTFKILAQSDLSGPTNLVNGKNNTATFGINIPVGEFSKTHFTGISLGYSWSRHRFGNLKALPKKLIGFIATGGIDYYFGRKETVAGYDYRYDGYVYVHALGGVIYTPYKKVNISLTTGPALGLYKGSADPGLGINLGGSYFLTNSISVSPGALFLKHKDAAPLWVFGIRAAWAF